MEVFQLSEPHLPSNDDIFLAGDNNARASLYVSELLDTLEEFIFPFLHAAQIDGHYLHELESDLVHNIDGLADLPIYLSRLKSYTNSSTYKEWWKKQSSGEASYNGAEFKLALRDVLHSCAALTKLVRRLKTDRNVLLGLRLASSEEPDSRATQTTVNVVRFWVRERYLRQQRGWWETILEAQRCCEIAQRLQLFGKAGYRAKIAPKEDKEEVIEDKKLNVWECAEGLRKRK